MIVFVVTLKDSLAEVLACASFLIGLVFNPHIRPFTGHRLVQLEHPKPTVTTFDRLRERIRTLRWCGNISD
jgi:hypothetical protein